MKIIYTTKRNEFKIGGKFKAWIEGDDFFLMSAFPLKADVRTIGNLKFLRLGFPTKKHIYYGWGGHSEHGFRYSIIEPSQQPKDNKGGAILLHARKASSLKKLMTS